MIVLPGPILLADPLPAGWRRCPSLGCGAPAGHAGEHVAEAVPPLPLPPALPREERETSRPVAGPEADVGAEVGGGAPTLADVAAVIDRAQRSLDAVPMPCAETMLAIDALESAESLVADLRIPDVIDVEDLASTWPEQWRSLVEADPSTLTTGAVRRRDAMIAIAAYVRATQPAHPTRAERIEAAARALVTEIARWQRGEVLGFGIPSSALPVAALRAALCTCTAHGPDQDCPEHGAAIRARMAEWSR